MPGKAAPVSSEGTWIVRDVPREMMQRTKIAAAIEGKSIKQFVIDLVAARLDELEKKGVLPKSR